MWMTLSQFTRNRSSRMSKANSVVTKDISGNNCLSSSFSAALRKRCAMTNPGALIPL